MRLTLSPHVDHFGGGRLKSKNVQEGRVTSEDSEWYKIDPR